VPGGGSKTYDMQHCLVLHSAIIVTALFSLGSIPTIDA